MNCLEIRRGGLIGITVFGTGQLNDSLPVAQIDEEHAPVVTDTMNPAGQTDRLSDMRGIQCGAGMAAKGVHDGSLRASVSEFGPIHRFACGKSSAARA